MADNWWTCPACSKRVRTANFAGDEAQCPDCKAAVVVQPTVPQNVEESADDLKHAASAFGTCCCILAWLTWAGALVVLLIGADHLGSFGVVSLIGANALIGVLLYGAGSFVRTFGRAHAAMLKAVAQQK